MVDPGEQTGRGKASSPAVPALAGAGVGLLALVLYLSTLSPGVLYYSRPGMIDAAMLQVHAATLGITHPTGYPGWVMLTHLFTYLPVEDVAYRVNLASAIYGVLAVTLVYIAGVLLRRRAVAAATGALAFGLGQIFWSQAVIAEVYTLNALFVALLLVVLLYWRETGRDRYLLAGCLFMGLAMTNHVTSGLLLPAGALFVYLVDRSRFTDWRLVLKGAGLFVAGLLPYLYLPIRASMNEGVREAAPDDFGSFWNHVSGGELNGVLFAFGPGEIPGRLAMYGGYALAEIPLPLLLVGAVGLGAMLVRDRVAAALTGILYLGWTVYALSYGIVDIYIYFIPTYLILALWISCGTGLLLGAAEDVVREFPSGLGKVATLLLPAAALLVPLAGVGETYAEVDRSDSDRGREIIETVAENTEPGATVLHNRSSLWYMVLVEERRRDLTLLDPFRSPAITTYDLVWPGHPTPEEADRRYGTGDHTGVEAAQQAAEEGPVYILDQGLVRGAVFHEAGFEVVPVERGMLYELLPAEET